MTFLMLVLALVAASLWGLRLVDFLMRIWNPNRPTT